jgi:hypothetical protein
MPEEQPSAEEVAKLQKQLEAAKKAAEPVIQRDQALRDAAEFDRTMWPDR